MPDLLPLIPWTPLAVAAIGAAVLMVAAVLPLMWRK